MVLLLSWNWMDRNKSAWSCLTVPFHIVIRLSKFILKFLSTFVSFKINLFHYLNLIFTVYVTHLAWHKEDRDFAIAFSDGTVKFGGHMPNHPTSSVMAHQVGSLCSVCDSVFLRLLNFDGYVHFPLQSALSGMKWSPDGRLLATCGSDGACRVWHLVDKTWCCLHSLPQANQPVSLEWSPLVGKLCEIYEIVIFSNFSDVVLDLFCKTLIFVNK